MLLWSGRPERGRRLFEFCGAERKVQVCLLVGVIGMWLTWPMIGEDRSLNTGDVIWLYGAVTLGLMLLSFYLATTRADVLGNLHYAVTDRRAIVRRSSRGGFLAARPFLLSCAHAPDFPYEIVAMRPYASLTVGYLMPYDLMWRFGPGLRHPGWEPFRFHNAIPVLFEQMEDAEAVRAVLMEAMADAGRRRR